MIRKGKKTKQKTHTHVYTHTHIPAHAHTYPPTHTYACTCTNLPIHTLSLSPTHYGHDPTKQICIFHLNVVLTTNNPQRVMIHAIAPSISCFCLLMAVHYLSYITEALISRYYNYSYFLYLTVK